MGHDRSAGPAGMDRPVEPLPSHSFLANNSSITLFSMTLRDSGISLPLDQSLPSESDDCLVAKPPTRTSSRQWDRRLKDKERPKEIRTEKGGYDKMSELKTMYHSFWNRVGTVEVSGAGHCFVCQAYVRAHAA
jgi:hypothetical protein